MPGAIVSLARSHMRQPVNIRAESAADTQMVPATAQVIYQVHDLDKTEMLARILQAEGSGRTIVFTRTKRASQRVADDLAERGFDCSPLHGDMAQAAREKALAKFRDGRVRVLVATDVAARGIDVQDVTHVVNYSCPEDHNTYVHRIGRTGRAGATGVAITFVDWADVTRWKVINRALELPFEDPPETYSTSDHFYDQLGIPRDVKGSVGPPTGSPRKPDDRGPRGSGGSRSSSGGSRSSSGGSRSSGSGSSRNRNRQRTRGGQPVDGSSPRETSGGDSSPSGEAGSGTPRRRRRRRGGSGGSGQGGSDAATSGSGGQTS
jgi:superfamily II DNA/RNA helicase